MNDPYIPAGRKNYYVRFLFKGRVVMHSLRTTTLSLAVKRAKLVHERAHDEHFAHPRAKKPAPASSLGSFIKAYLTWPVNTMRCRRNNVLQLLHIVCPATRHVWTPQSAPLNREHAREMRKERRKQMAAVESAKADVQARTTSIQCILVPVEANASRTRMLSASL